MHRMQNPKRLSGDLEELIVLAVLRLGNSAHNSRIKGLLEQATGRTVHAAAILETCRRLESKGYVTTRLGEPVPQVGGRPRRYYSVTPEGRAALTEIQRIRRHIVGASGKARS